MTFPKRTFEKPIPISPTIALDRERCILCYRCTRFSEAVAEDGQLVARDRGANSIIATFEDEPYRAPFSGNVIELCPVGALTSTQYRFEARPWEIQNVPRSAASVRSAQRQRDHARGQGQADPLPQPSRDRRGLALRQGPLRLHPALRRRPRPRPGAEAASAGLEEIVWDAALDEAERLLRSGGGAARALGLRDGRAGRGALRLVRQGLGSDAVVLPEQASPRSTRSARRSRRSATPTSSSSRRRPGRGARAGRRALDQGARRTAPRSSPSAPPGRSRPCRAPRRGGPRSSASRSASAWC